MLTPVRYPLSFSYLAFYAAKLKQGEIVPRLLRKPEIQSLYDQHRLQLPNEKLPEHIKQTYLGQHMHALTLNQFPLYIADSISHYVLWSTAPYFDKESFIESCIGNRTFVLFENPTEWKSIPEVPHWHVFVEHSPCVSQTSLL